MKRILSIALAILIFMGVLSTVTFAEDNSVSSKMGENSYTVMGNNILMVKLYEKERPTKRLEQLLYAYEKINPDIFGLQECDELWHEVLDGENGFVTLGYAPAVTGFGNLNNPIYYKDDKFRVLDCGFEKYNASNAYSYTWALFEVLATGEKFIVSSTHFTWVSLDAWETRDAEAKELLVGLSELEEQYGAPVIFLGDFNSHLNEAAYKRLSSAYSSARECAAETVNMEYKTENAIACMPHFSYNGLSQIDHIFYTRDKVVGERYEVLVSPMAYAYADHVPHILTFKLVHEHSFESLENDGDTHTGVCTECKEKLTLQHSYVWESVDAKTCRGRCECGKTVEREHVYDAYEMTSDTHIAKCACGALDKTGAHSFGAGVCEREATYFRAGQITYTCSVCGMEKYEEIPILPVPESGYELEGFGQKHFEAAITESAPVADGVIGDGEYSLAIENMTHTPEKKDENSFIINGPGRVEAMSIYATATDEVIAVAFKLKVTSAKNGDRVAVDLGFKKETDKVMRYNLKYSSSGGSIGYADDGGAGYVDSYKTKYEDGYITYELVLKRMFVEKYAGQELDKMYLRAITVLPNGTATEEMWFGFTCAAPLNTVHTMKLNRYPHVISFVEKEVPTETESQTEYLPESEADTEIESVTETENAVEENNTGCGATLASGSVALVGSVAACAALAKKRKEDE